MIRSSTIANNLIIFQEWRVPDEYLVMLYWADFLNAQPHPIPPHPLLIPLCHGGAFEF